MKGRRLGAEKQTRPRFKITVANNLIMDQYNFWPRYFTVFVIQNTELHHKLGVAIFAPQGNYLLIKIFNITCLAYNAVNVVVPENGLKVRAD